jgi:DNA-binding MarR family transcriptional regulator
MSLHSSAVAARLREGAGQRGEEAGRGAQGATARLGGPPVEESRLACWRAFLNAHRRVIGRIERDLQAEGLPPLVWYDVLWALYSAPQRRVRISELADHVVLSRTGMVRLVDRIEAAGLLRREPVPEDRRGAYAVVTDEGVEMLRRMWPLYARGIQELFVAPVGDDDAGVMHLALERVAAGARTDQD